MINSFTTLLKRHKIEILFNSIVSEVDILEGDEILIKINSEDDLVKRVSVTQLVVSHGTDLPKICVRGEELKIEEKDGR